MQKFQLVLLLHAHQPVGNFDDVLENAYAKCYLPFVEALARHPAISVGLHYSGSLLEWIEKAHPEYFERLRDFVRRGQVEMIGGGFYEPILIAIPPEDRIEQIRRLADYVERHFGARPSGAWLAERVWEPQLPSTLKAAGVDYTLVDDNHFLGGGFEMEQLYGYYISEDQGQIVRIIPGLKSLRYLIPFRSVEETMQYLRKTASEHPGGFATMGDDLEKFGSWPGTHDHCYPNGWIDNFLSAVESNADWLETAMPANAIGSHVAMGRADLPTASYTEMMEWALPTTARNRYHRLTQEFTSRPKDLPFVRGGIWRNFFSKYSESNLLQKKMLHVSGKLRHLSRARRPDAEFSRQLSEGTTLLLRSQCNDPYWHGIFGGLYAPHLRTAPWRSVVEAETIADRLLHRRSEYAEAITLDFDGDGNDEVYFTSERYAVLLEPEDGGTISVIDCRDAKATLINSLRRRPESYHAKIRCKVEQNAGSVQSIHEQMRTKEEGLEGWLRYDRWEQNCFRLLLFAHDKTHRDCEMIQLEEDAELAGGPYIASAVSNERIALSSPDGSDWSAQKIFSLSRNDTGFDIVCDVVLKRGAQDAVSAKLGIEVVINFLAPSAPDRYFESGGTRYPLRWSAAVPASQLRVADEWQKVSVTLVAPGASEFWICPIETVSESEDGFERIYQGSKIVTVWPVRLSGGGEWKGRLIFKTAVLG
ncbi:MAG TPA: alpha-amylase/4-alpha-glucanotransferase domain-containing protein [Candidatus Acidoferrales bacterium]|nr:alpha-amylase/4-alpha-glucanotransferase domain-containing protein [Candidatus Acidoferrales bacterium]